MQFFTCAFCHVVQPATFPVDDKNDKRPISEYLDDQDDEDDFLLNDE